ncbi:MAG: hypothetical protein A7315_08585 [Candidatus Altiarchaeales archaeon WOR_SM1_79]|nr:MAG: hypothetical protein A7315_08585 [Candidatus Altiarchaeales archaeon WOR_SM1_79]
MKAKKSGNKFAVRIDKREETIETLKQFCRDNCIKPGTVQGIGAANKAVIGLFDAETKKYHSRALAGKHEIAPLPGNISTRNFNHF